MLTVAIIAFREFLEAFLIVGVFLGISKKLNLKKEREIIFAAVLGILISFLFAMTTYQMGDFAKEILTERNADFLESYLLIFSGLFIVYVVFSLHNVMRSSRGKTLISAHKKLQENVFDLSLFFTIVFLVVREGFEIALFTATTSLFSIFFQNLEGLFLGFAASSVVTLATIFTYLKFSLGKLLKTTEYAIVLLGAALVQNGITQMLELNFNIHLGKMLSLPLNFLPTEESIVGHMLKNLIGIDRDFSLVRFSIMVLYIGIVYFIFLRDKKKSYDK